MQVSLASVALVFCLAAASLQQVAVANGFLGGRIQDKALFETVMLLTHEHPVESRTVFEGFATKFVKNAKERQDFIEKMDDILVQPLAENDGGCQLCQVRSATAAVYIAYDLLFVLIARCC